MLGRSRDRDRGRGYGVEGFDLLYQEATLYLNGVGPFHWLDFVNDRALYAGNDAGNLTGATGYSFSRASAGTYTTAGGTVSSFASGALRRSDRGVLIEGARTNLCPRSQEFDNASWTKTGVTTTANTTAAPDGTTTADTVTETATTGLHFTLTAAPTATGLNCYSVYGKLASGTRYLQIRPYGLGSVAYANFDLSSGVVVPGGTGGLQLVSTSIEALANGWYRCVMVANHAIASPGIYIGPSAGTAENAPYTGDGTSGLHLWGAQLEAGGFPSSYVPTEAASVVRAGSAYLSATTSGLDSAVSMWAQALFPVTTGAVQTIAQFDDGTADNRLILRRNASGDAEMELITAGASQGIVTGGAMSNNTIHKIACSATTNALRLALNGTSATPDTSATMPTGLVNIRVGAGVSIALPSFGYHPRWAMFNSALSGAQLETVTGS